MSRARSSRPSRRAIHAEYHRSGVAGRSFFVLRFKDRDAARENDLPGDSEFIAIVTDLTDHSSVCVLNLANLRARWRCEAFAPFVIEAIIDAGDKMYVHEK